MVRGSNTGWRRDFPHPSTPALEPHPTSYTIRIGSYPGVKRPGRGVNHPPSSSAEVKETVELYLCSSFWAFVACLRVKCTFTFTRNTYGEVKVKPPIIVQHGTRYRAILLFTRRLLYNRGRTQKRGCVSSRSCQCALENRKI
jgi:hypothetical protein